jgi:MtN3 and saliva related transmembrane protein
MPSSASSTVRAGVDRVTEALGWLSSCVLVLTIGRQVYKQWRDRTSQGVSKWLFVGQMVASSGFTAYSWLVRNWVFVVTNALLLISAVLGFAIVLIHRRRSPAAADEQRRGGRGEAIA